MEIPRPENPRPDFRREDWLNLNGRWQFQIDRSSRKIAQDPKSVDFSKKIIVPFPPESKLSSIGETDFMNVVWYRRKFKIPRSWSGKKVLLRFGAVDYEAKVWVNGREIGSHKGGYTPFSFDVTHVISFDESNEVVVKAIDDNRNWLHASGKQSPRRNSFSCYYTRVTGIWQTVWIEAVPNIYISHFKIIPIFPNHIYVEIDMKGKRKQSNLRVEASLEGKNVLFYSMKASSNPTIFSINAANLKRWSPEDPILYDLRLEAFDDKDEEGVDVVHSYLGFRRVGIKGESILLNERKRFLRLVLDQGYYPDGIYTAPSDRAIKRDIELSMEMGFDGARLHQKVFEPRFLYWSDRLGYLVTGEYADWGADLTNPIAREAILDEWVEVIERDINHPSIIIWIPFNERRFKKSDKAITSFLKRIYRLTKSLDPTRPVIDTSGYIHVETDIYDIHDYEQNPSIFRSHYEIFGKTGSKHDLWVNFQDENAEYSGQPVMISEYGGTWWNPEHPQDKKAWGYGKKPSTANEFLTRYAALTESLLSNPRISAFCYTQLYDIEQEVNGLLSYERKPKFNAKTIRDINTQAAAIEIESTKP